MTKKAQKDFPRCGAKTRSGKPCKRAHAKDYKRCRLHGGAPGSGRPITHGRYSKRFRQMAPQMTQLINECMEDPQLLDLKRPVAIIQAIQFDQPMAYDDDTLREMATTPQQRHKKEEATDAQVAKLRTRLNRKNVTLALDLQRAQQIAVREASLKDTLGNAIAPLIANLLERFTAQIHQHVKDEGERARLLEGTRNEFPAAIVNAFKIGEDIR